MSNEILHRIAKLERQAGVRVDTPAVKFAKVSTSDATATTLLSVTTDTDTVMLIEAHVVARRTAGANQGAGYVIRGTYRNDAGVVSLVGAVGADYTAEDNAAWDATLDISGTAVRVRVTGAAAVAITWFGRVEVWRAST